MALVEELGQIETQAVVERVGQGMVVGLDGVMGLAG